MVAFGLESATLLGPVAFCGVLDDPDLKIATAELLGSSFTHPGLDDDLNLEEGSGKP